MKCKQKHKNGKPCKYRAGDGSQFCYSHDPNLLPLFFIQDVDNYKTNNSEPNLPIKKAKEYIDDGFAIEETYAVRVRIEKGLLRGLKKLSKTIVTAVKGCIADNDDDSLAEFFGEDVKNNRKIISKFINKKDFSHHEKAYLKRFLKNRRSQIL